MGRAVSEKQSEIREKLELSVKEPESDDDTELEIGLWTFNAEFDWSFDIWEFINNILDAENFDSENRLCGHAVTKRGVELILFYMRNAEAWRRTDIYRSMWKIAKQKSIGLTLQKALKYAIGRKKIEILSHFKNAFEYGDDDKSESEQCIYFHDLKEELFSIKRKIRKEKRFNLLHPVVRPQCYDCYYFNCFCY